MTYTVLYKNAQRLRQVRLPASKTFADTEALLEAIYQAAQNDVNPSDFPSASVGDRIFLGAEGMWRIDSAGFSRITHGYGTEDGSPEKKDGR